MAQDDKLWTQPALYALAKQAALEAIQSQGGLALPCQVIALNPNSPVTGQPLGYSFVQVQFEVNVPYTLPDGSTGTYTLPPLILPKAEGQWVRAATQVGDFGVTQALITSHGGVSGMSAGVSNLGTAYGNLSTLVFVPIANTSFGAAPSPNRTWINGIQGADTSDTAQTAITTHTQNNITHTAGVGTAAQVQTIYDGSGNAISHIVSSGGLIGIGALASSLSSTNSALNQTHLGTYEGRRQTANLDDLIANANLYHTAGVITSGQLTTILAALVAGFTNAITTNNIGSAIVRVTS